MLIQRRIDEIPTEEGWAFNEWTVRKCKGLNALPLHHNMLYMWAIKPDETVLCIDLIDLPIDIETDPLTLYAVLAQGSQKYPELQELVPIPSEDTRKCNTCEGTGRVEPAEGESYYAACCSGCRGLGWTVSGSSGKSI